MSPRGQPSPEEPSRAFIFYIMNEHEQYIRAWYASLCAKARQVTLKDLDTPCAHCERPKKDHFDCRLRCSLFATSTNYRASNQHDVEVMNHTITALENLASACGWSLG